MHQLRRRNLLELQTMLLDEVLRSLLESRQPPCRDAGQTERVRKRLGLASFDELVAAGRTPRLDDGLWWICGRGSLGLVDFLWLEAGKLLFKR